MYFPGDKRCLIDVGPSTTAVLLLLLLLLLLRLLLLMSCVVAGGLRQRSWYDIGVAIVNPSTAGGVSYQSGGR